LKNPDHEAKQLLLDQYALLKSNEKKVASLQKQFKQFVVERKDMLGDLARYKHVDARGPYVSRRNLDKPDIYGYKYNVYHPLTKKKCLMPYNGWRYPETSMKQLIKEGRILFGKDETRIPQLKVYHQKLQCFNRLRIVSELYEALINDFSPSFCSDVAAQIHI
jgi:adenine-specific DNA-methyltransferase